MRLLVIVFLAFLAKADEVFSESERKISPRLYFNLLKDDNEVAAIPHQFPHQVFYVTDKGTYCGGVIIHNRAVLTAASCLYDKTQPVVNVQVIPGIYNISNPEAQWQIKYSQKITRHTNYDATTKKNDIAIITFQYPFVFDGKLLNPILLHESKADLSGKDATASGWGWSLDSSISNKLHYFTSKVLTNQKCREAIGNKVTDTNVCLDEIPGSGKCNIDLGGPLHYAENNKLYLAGIYSFGADTTSCVKGKPTAYTRISSYIEWINNNLPK